MVKMEKMEIVNLSYRWPFCLSYVSWHNWIHVFVISGMLKSPGTSGSPPSSGSRVGPLALTVLGGLKGHAAKYQINQLRQWQQRPIWRSTSVAGVRASHVVLDVIQEGTAMRKCSEMFTTVGKHGGQAVHNHVSQWGMNIGDVTFTPTQGHALESSGASPGQSAPLSLPGCHWEREKFKGGPLGQGTST